MRLDEDDDEDDYDDDHDQDQDQDQEQENEHDQEQEQENEDGDEEDDNMNGDDDDGSGDNSDEDGSDDDEDEDEDDQDEDEDGDGDNDDDDEDDDEEDDEDDHSDGDGEAGDTRTRDRNVTPSRGEASTSTTTPPHIRRRRELVPQLPPKYTSLALDAIVGIPTPGPVHSMATSMCSSFLLTGSQDGHIRAYDTWSSVNGSQTMTAQQRAVVGLGETINKAGVFRGWWSNEVEVGTGDEAWKGLEPVYSLACQNDALWAASGTRSGPINLYTLRHSPGHLVHSLKGHSSVVSCLSVLPGEQGLLSGSWDGTIRDWDLNTGQTSQTYYTHGAQISSLAMRPVSSGTEAEPTEGGVLVNVGPDFFEADRAKSNGVDSNGNGEGIEKKETSPTSPAPNTTATSPKPEPNGTPPPATDTLMPPPDVDMDEGSPYDPLFDDDMGGDADAEGESVIPSTGNTALPTPMAGSPPPSATPGLALPTASGLDSTSVLPSNGFDTPPTTSQVSGDVTSSKTQGQSPPGPTPLFAQTPAQAQAHPSREGAARGIPLLTRTSYAAFSSDIMMTSTMDGQVTLMDRRMPEGGRVGRLQGGEKAPPWCMSACWSGDGNQVLAGRRNGTLDIWDVRRTSNSRAPNLLRTLKTPTESGSISCVVAFPDGRHIATASQDNIRLWNTVEYFDVEESMKRSKSRPPFKIVAGHHGGTISSMIVDPTCNFLFAASGDRGWQGEATKVVLIHDIKAV